MAVEVEPHGQAGFEDAEIQGLLRDVFVGEGYAAPEAADFAFTITALRTRGALWVARLDQRLAGVVLLVDPGNPHRQIAVAGEVEVHLLAVSPGHRRAGVGEALMKRVHMEARGRGAARIVLSTQPTMRAAHALYRKLDFRHCPERDWSRPDGRRYLAFVLELEPSPSASPAA
jgi:ribosomal protein S18 acetylase RimI-like enzyme